MSAPVSPPNDVLELRVEDIVIRKPNGDWYRPGYFDRQGAYVASLTIKEVPDDE